jgi:hypothetical protein
MNDTLSSLENLWDRLLSRDLALVRSTFNELSAGEQQAVARHLKRMVSEPGWHPEQQLSAQTALEAIEKKE